MNYYIGIDGGGTKTAFTLADQKGTIVKSIIKEGTSYKHVGWETLFSRIQKGVKEILEGITYQKEAVYICFGAPNYGESKANDAILDRELRVVLEGFCLSIVNDCQVGWAGSLGLEAGINIVAGTGSIAYGKDESENTAICGGWSDFFSDEGSGRWLGVKAMELFGKQADGRVPMGHLYELMLKHFGVTDSIDVIDIFEEEYQPYRDKLGSLQRVLQEAAKHGDITALALYEQAAYELSLMIIGVYRKLKFPKGCKVSYSGGLFQVGELILNPLKEQLKLLPVELVKPLQEPVVGAVLLAANMAGEKIIINGGQKTCI